MFFLRCQISGAIRVISSPFSPTVVVSEADQGITHKTKRKRADVGLKTKMECNMLVGGCVVR